ncbi:Protein FAM53B [Larimichthys crocea]|uniref:Protein FAM53B n=1 Tax=Larimichthys crocea TaxID=215358 RepID=A0A6G0HNB8_LARCR|nr:Protein FAM53B [Larimichthys crocea]
MVIIFLKTLEKKKGVNDVRSKNIERRLRDLHTMSRGTTLFSCGTVEADRWLDIGQSCAIQQRTPCQSGASLESLWDVMPEPGSWHWAKEPGNATAITSLIRDLSLGDGSIASPNSLTTSTTAHYTTTATSQAPTAPPSKRQCRSLSFSDEFSGFRSSWRPQGSRVWTTVEKRSSLPLQSPLPLLPRIITTPTITTSSGRCPSPMSRSVCRSSRGKRHRRPALQTPPQNWGDVPGQRTGGTGCLSRSRSQPCVLNDKKIGMKRRRPEDAQEQRPSLDLAKMTQKLQTFQSLSCPGFSATDSCQSSLPPPTYETSGQPDSDFTAMPELGLESRQDVVVDDEEEDSSYEELDSDSACSVDSRPGSPVGIAGGKRTLWKGDCGTQRDIFQLGGELDLDQIERN